MEWLFRSNRVDPAREIRELGVLVHTSQLDHVRFNWRGWGSLWNSRYRDWISGFLSGRDDRLDHYLGEFRAGRCDDAFHSLIEADSASISDLINANEDKDDIDTKVFVIEVISAFRLDSSLCFLRHALRRDEPRIWKAALSGMAMAESTEAVDAMNHVLSSVQDSTKRDWIEEAITDTSAAITKKQNKPRMH